MLIIGCDFHPGGQQIAYLDTETGEYCEQRLSHSNGEAERFYRELHQKTDGIRVGIEAPGDARWFERLLGELGCELCYESAETEDRSTGCPTTVEANA